MTNTFLNKVAAERQVLSIINGRYRGSEQLAGLSRSTIELWQRNVRSPISTEVVSSLLALGELCQSLSDKSHESLKPLNPGIESALEHELAALEMAVSRKDTEKGSV